MAKKIKDPEAVADIKEIIGELVELEERCDFHYVDTTDEEDDRFYDAKESVGAAIEYLRSAI